MEKVMQSNSTTNLRQNLIIADGKSFGKIFEIVVSRLNGLQKASDASHDRFCKKTSNRIEVKSTRAFHKVKKITEENLSDLMLERTTAKTLVPDIKKHEYEWDSGICQIKTGCFDLLYYAVVFFEKIYIFRCTSQDVLDDEQIGFSDKQHRNGKMGQFHISPKNIAHHIEKYLFHTLNYDQLIAILNYKP